MAIDADYIKRFEMQVELLRQLQEEVGKAISRAEDRIKDMRQEIEKQAAGGRQAR